MIQETAECNEQLSNSDRQNAGKCSSRSTWHRGEEGHLVDKQGNTTRHCDTCVILDYPGW